MQGHLSPSAAPDSAPQASPNSLSDHATVRLSSDFRQSPSSSAWSAHTAGYTSDNELSQGLPGLLHDDGPFFSKDVSKHERGQVILSSSLVMPTASSSPAREDTHVKMFECLGRLIGCFKGQASQDTLQQPAAQGLIDDRTSSSLTRQQVAAILARLPSAKQHAVLHFMDGKFRDLQHAHQLQQEEATAARDAAMAAALVHIGDLQAQLAAVQAADITKELHVQELEHHVADLKLSSAVKDAGTEQLLQELHTAVQQLGDCETDLQAAVDANAVGSQQLMKAQSDASALQSKLAALLVVMQHQQAGCSKSNAAVVVLQQAVKQQQEQHADVCMQLTACRQQVQEQQQQQVDAQLRHAAVEQGMRQREADAQAEVARLHTANQGLQQLLKRKEADLQAAQSAQMSHQLDIKQLQQQVQQQTKDAHAATLSHSAAVEQLQKQLQKHEEESRAAELSHTAAVDQLHQRLQQQVKDAQTMGAPLISAIEKLQKQLQQQEQEAQAVERSHTAALEQLQQQLQNQERGAQAAGRPHNAPWMQMKPQQSWQRQKQDTQTAGPERNAPGLQMKVQQQADPYPLQLDAQQLQNQLRATEGRLKLAEASIVQLSQQVDDRNRRICELQGILKQQQQAEQPAHGDRVYELQQQVASLQAQLQSQQQHLPRKHRACHQQQQYEMAAGNDSVMVARLQQQVADLQAQLHDQQQLKQWEVEALQRKVDQHFNQAMNLGNRCTLLGIQLESTMTLLQGLTWVLSKGPLGMARRVARWIEVNQQKKDQYAFVLDEAVSLVKTAVKALQDLWR